MVILCPQIQHIWMASKPSFQWACFDIKLCCYSRTFRMVLSASSSPLDVVWHCLTRHGLREPGKYRSDRAHKVSPLPQWAFIKNWSRRMLNQNCRALSFSKVFSLLIFNVPEINEWQSHASVCIIHLCYCNTLSLNIFRIANVCW